MARATLISWEWCETPLQVWNTEVSVIGIWYTFGRRGNLWSLNTVKSHFQTSLLLCADIAQCAVVLLYCSVFESSNSGVTKTVDKRPHYIHCLFSEVILYWPRYIVDWSVSVVRSWEVSASWRFEMYYSCMVKSIGGKFSPMPGISPASAANMATHTWTKLGPLPEATQSTIFYIKFSLPVTGLLSSVEAQISVTRASTSVVFASGPQYRILTVALHWSCMLQVDLREIFEYAH